MNTEPLEYVDPAGDYEEEEDSEYIYQTPSYQPPQSLLYTYDNEPTYDYVQPQAPSYEYVEPTYDYVQPRSVW